MNDLVKQDINFMEYPLWLQDEKLANKSKDGYVWEDRDGYTYRAGYRPPTKTDFLFLLYFLKQSQLNNWQTNIKTTKYETLKGCGIKIGKPQYDRLKDSLKRWKMVGIEFEGTFYNGKKYEVLGFGIIDDYKIEENSKYVEVKLSSNWLYKIQESNFFKYINFEHIKALRSPLNVRLYEILVKNFQGRSRWEIDVMKLALKIPMNEKYPADVIPKIKASINRINNHSDLKLKLTIKHIKRGKAILVFEKLPDEKLNTAPQLNLLENTPPDSKKHEEEYKKCLDRLPEELNKQKTVQDIIEKYLKQKGFDYTMSNIVYAIKNANKNFKYYLEKSLKNDYGKDIRAEFLAKKEIAEAEKKAKEEEEKKEKEKKERRENEKKELMDFYNSLSKTEQERIDKEAENKLNQIERTILIKNRESKAIQDTINIKKLKILKELQDKEAQTKKTKPTQKKAIEINQESRKQGNIKEQIKTEFNATVENKIKETIKNFTPQQKENATQEFKQELKKEGRLGEIILKTLETKGINSPAVKIYFENFVGKFYLQEKEKDFYLWVETKGYNLKDVI